MTNKIAINKAVGGFALSESAVRWLREHGHPAADEIVLPGEYYDDGSGPAEPTSNTYPIGWYDIDRDDELLIECIEALGDDAAGEYADLEVVEIDPDEDVTIESVHGVERLVRTDE